MLLFLISRSGNRACVGAEQSSRPKLPRLGVSWEEHKIPLPPLLSSHTQEHTHTHILTHTQRPPPVSVPMYLRCQMAEDKSSWGKTAWWPLPSLTRTFSQIEDTWKYRAVVVSWGSVVGGGGGGLLVIPISEHPRTQREDGLLRVGCDARLTVLALKKKTILKTSWFSHPGLYWTWAASTLSAAQTELPDDTISPPPAWFWLTRPQTHAAMQYSWKVSKSFHEETVVGVVVVTVGLLRDSPEEKDEIRTSGMNEGDMRRAGVDCTSCWCPYWSKLCQRTAVVRGNTRSGWVSVVWILKRKD